MANVFGFSYPGPGATLGSGLTFGYRAGKHLTRSPPFRTGVADRGEQAHRPVRALKVYGLSIRTIGRSLLRFDPVLGPSHLLPPP